MLNSCWTRLILHHLIQLPRLVCTLESLEWYGILFEMRCNFFVPLTILQSAMTRAVKWTLILAHSWLCTLACEECVTGPKSPNALMFHLVSSHFRQNTNRHSFTYWRSPASLFVNTLYVDTIFKLSLYAKHHSVTTVGPNHYNITPATRITLM